MEINKNLEACLELQRGQVMESRKRDKIIKTKKDWRIIKNI